MSLKWGRKQPPKSRNPESPKQDKPKDKDPKTHINQTNEDKTQRANIKSSKGKATNNTPIRKTANLSIETLQVRREWQDILKVMKEKNVLSGAVLEITDKMEAWQQTPLLIPQAQPRDEGVRLCNSDLSFPLLA